MNLSLIAALLGAVINMVLSVVIPCLINKSQQPLLQQIKEVYDSNRKLIVVSSLIIAITIYMAIEFAPEIQDMMEDSDVAPAYASNDQALNMLRQMGGSY
jgi:galactitol-specific phosphotransferase system IIC component